MHRTLTVIFHSGQTPPLFLFLPHPFLSLSHSVFYTPMKITHKSNYTLFLSWPDPISFSTPFYVISTVSYWFHDSSHIK